MAAAPLHPVMIDDWSDPRVAVYAGLRDAERRIDRLGRQAGHFIAEGEGVVRVLVASPYRVRSVLVTPRRLETVADALEALEPGTPVYVVEQPLMNRLVGFNIHRGILAIGDRGPEHSPESLIATSRTLVMLENLSNHDNVGGIFRSVAALAPGAAVLLSPGCCDPLYRKSIRVSMGRALTVPFARAHDWPFGLKSVRAAGFEVIALTPSPGAEPIDRVQTGPGRIAMLLGAEGEGLSAGALELADRSVRIPLAPGVDSLNVSVAAAIALHRLGNVPTGANPPPRRAVVVE